MKYFIFQVLGSPKYYRKVEYRVDGSSFNCVLSSEALARHFKGLNHDARLIFIVPKSLALDVAADASEVKCLLENNDALVEKVRERLKEKGVGVDSDVNIEFIVSQSMGFYSSSQNTRNVRVLFNNELSNIVSRLKLDILKILINNLTDSIDGFKIVVDVSTGLNTYTMALVECLRATIVFFKLMHVLQGGCNLGAYISSSPPIKEDKISYPLSIYEYDVKAFFEFPYVSKKASEKIGIRDFADVGDLNVERELGRRFGAYIGNIDRQIKAARKAFNSVKHNVLLAPLYDDIVDLRELRDLSDFKQMFNGINSILDDVERAMTFKSTEVDGGSMMMRIKRRFRINDRSITNLLFTSALAYSLTRFIEDMRSYMVDGGIDAERLREIAEKTFNAVNLRVNIRFLERDLRRLEKAAEALGEGEEKLLKDLIVRDEGVRQAHVGEEPYGSDEKRNFLAHSGLLKEFIILKKIQGKTILTYSDSKRRMITKYLENPE